MPIKYTEPTGENAQILGGVSQDSMNFIAIPILWDKDDHVLHLQQVHNPKANEFIQAPSKT